LAEAGPEAPTLCEGWLTRDLAAHLFVREHRPLAMPGILVGGPLARLTAGSMAAALHSYGYRGLVAKVRSGPPLLWRPVDEAANLVEFYVHGEDVRRAGPGRGPRDDPQLDAALWARLGHMAKLLARKVRGAGLELERPDGERLVARRGEPRAVLSGGPQELVLFLEGRGGVADVTLSGPEEAQGAVRAARFGI
jgi:uncharacterized protein (TIGR03085 family)